MSKSNMVPQPQTLHALPFPPPHSFIPTLLSSLSRGLLQRDALLAASPSACTHIALEDRYAVVPSGELDQRVPPTHVEQPRPVTSPTAHAGHPTRPHTRHDDSYGSCLSSDGSKECVDAEGVSGPAEATQYEEQLHQSLCDALSVPDTDGDGGGGEGGLHGEVRKGVEPNTAKKKPRIRASC